MQHLRDMPRKLDSIIVITVLTANPESRDRIDQVIDKMFVGDERVQLVRVVGYPTTGDIAGLSRKIDEATKSTC